MKSNYISPLMSRWPLTRYLYLHLKASTTPRSRLTTSDEHILNHEVAEVASKPLKMDHSSAHATMDMDMPDDSCSMNVRLLPSATPIPTVFLPSHSPLTHDNQMLFTWSTHNLCIIFPSWRITSTLSLLFSLLAIVALTAGYEAVRELSRRYEVASARWEARGDRERDGGGYAGTLHYPPLPGSRRIPRS